jgi:conjugal transfer/entry exclusion protein
MTTQSLLSGLKEYRDQLLIHMTQLQQEYSELEMRWNHLDQVFSGEAADQFRSHWRNTVEGYHEYLRQAKQVAENLEERIGYLEEYNRRFSVI